MKIEELLKVESITEFFKINDVNNIPEGTMLLLSAMTEVCFEDKQDVVTLGADSDDGMYIILEGVTDVLDKNGNIINTLYAGDFIGELGLINDDKRGATVRANGSVRCANISKELFEDLAAKNRKIYGSFMNMLYTKTTKLVTERERIKSELAVATKIQADCLENDFTPFNAIDTFMVSANMRPAKEVGGDFYDIFKVDDTHICFLIADVSGKGVPAALFMSMGKIYIKSFVMSGVPLNEMAMKVNDQLCQKNESNMFITALICILDIETGEVKFINAGHNKPFVLDSTGDFKMLDTKVNLVFGMMEGVPYKVQTFNLNVGDCFYLYTDGVNEAVNKEFELFGDDRLCDTLNAHKDITADVDAFVKVMYEEVDKFADGAEQADDITMLYVSRK